MASHRADGVPAAMRAGWAVASALVLAACTTTYVAEENAAKPMSELAEFDWSGAATGLTWMESIDGIFDESFHGGTVTGGARSAHLSPGLHNIRLERTKARCGFPFCTYDSPYAIVVILELRPGHEYRYEEECPHSFWRGCVYASEYVAWVEDVTAGEVVWGKKPE